MEQLIKNETLSEKEIENLREKFKIQYSRLKGWDAGHLSPEQILEITQQKGWKTPGMLFS